MVHDTAVRIIQYRDARPVGEQDNTVLFVCLFVCVLELLSSPGLNAKCKFASSLGNNWRKSAECGSSMNLNL